MGLEELPFFGEGDELKFRAKVLDRAGNQTHYTASATTLTVKQTLPTVTSVTSTNDNKAYKAADALSIQVIMSEAINVVGTPKLKLKTSPSVPAHASDNDAVISYTSGTTTNTLVFTYTIAFPHTSSDLNYFDTASLTLGGTDTVLDNFGNPLTLTLPAIDDSNALIKKKDLVIDTKLPSVRFTLSLIHI